MVRAPAKINLYLHVTGKRPDDYHLLDSLVVFTSFGDTVSASSAAVGEGLQLVVDGPFADQVGEDQDNLVMRAARLLADTCNPPSRDVTMRLTKRLPVAAGIGGGSSDAAATLRALTRYWDLDIGEEDVLELGSQLGADVPMCLYRKPVLVSGIGDKLTPGPELPWLSLVLVNPGVPLATPDVFQAFDSPYSTAPSSVEFTDTTEGFVEFLRTRDNDLTNAAVTQVPEISRVLDVINQQQGCLLARMSGSGATCFGLFSDSQQAANARKSVASDHPHWWAESMTLL